MADVGEASWVRRVVADWHCFSVHTLSLQRATPASQSRQGDEEEEGAWLVANAFGEYILDIKISQAEALEPRTLADWPLWKKAVGERAAPRG